MDDAARQADLGFTLGDEVRVRLRPGCPGADRPHDSSENGAVGRITSIADHGGHAIFVLFRTRVVRTAMGFPANVLGRPYRPDELELIERDDEPSASGRPTLATTGLPRDGDEVRGRPVPFKTSCHTWPCRPYTAAWLPMRSSPSMRRGLARGPCLPMLRT